MRWALQYYSALIHLFGDVPIEVLVGHCAFYAVLMRIHVHSFNYMQWAYYVKRQVFQVKTRGAPMGRPKLELFTSNGVLICHAI